MNGLDGQSLQNVLSISTAANNRYLLHFNSLHSLTQWTAGIRLAMFEHSSLQEAYTGSIIAGKGKHLNGIRTIMERARFPTEDWARVRFGAGTPWRRCWCVIIPPDEKESAKAQKEAKKRSAYEKARSVKGEIKFYETKKVTKKTRPIATIKNAYAAYSIYPQSKPLIDASTLVKVEGSIIIHSSPETTTEGFVFVMPEVHPAITGFEMMIRWLLPTFDTFALYGRPNKLIADVMDARSLMFAMPSGRRYGYLDLIDVAGLIHTEGSHDWSERQWRKELKQLTSKRMAAPGQPNRTVSSDQYGSKSSTNLPQHQTRSSLNLPSQGGGVRFAGVSTRSQPGSRQASPHRNGNLGSQNRNMSDPSLAQKGYRQQHQRANSEAYRPTHSSNLSADQIEVDNLAPVPPPHREPSPAPPPHRDASQAPPTPQHGPPTIAQYQPAPNQTRYGRDEYPEVAGDGSDDNPSDTTLGHDAHHANENGYSRPPAFGLPPVSAGSREPFRPVAAPPMMAHKSNAHPPRRPAQAPDMRRANSALDSATIAQLKAANPGRLNGVSRQDGPYQPQPYPQNNHQSSPYQPNSHQPNGVPNGGYALNNAPAPNYTSAPNGPYQPQRDDNQQYYQPYQVQASSGMRRAAPPPTGLGPPPTPYAYANSASGSSNNSLPERRLPTIPGTPAAEADRFDLTPEPDQGLHPPMERARSSNSIQRKPVPVAR